jgi:hypothetical protein
MKPKVFNKSKITKTELRKLMIRFAKELGVKRVTFTNRAKRVKGTYNAFTKSLFIDLKQTKAEMLCTLFHEMGHHFAVKRNKWRGYHFCTIPSMKVDKIFKIENGVDCIGRQLWYKYVDTKQWGKYKYSYPKTQKNNIIKNFISKQ